MGTLMPSDAQLSQDRQRATQIVTAYLRHHQVPADQVSSLIATVHQALGQLGKPQEPELTPAVPIRRSVQREYVVCLECGWQGKMLRRHLASAHQLTPAAYRERWSLSRDHTLTAPAYSDQRSGLAKQLGLGRRRRADTEAQPEPKKRSRRPPRRRSPASKRSAAPVESGPGK
jgi:predicted transcriptional regulator